MISNLLSLAGTDGGREHRDYAFVGAVSGYPHQFSRSAPAQRARAAGTRTVIGQLVIRIGFCRAEPPSLDGRGGRVMRLHLQAGGVNSLRRGAHQVALHSRDGSGWCWDRALGRLGTAHHRKFQYRWRSPHGPHGWRNPRTANGASAARARRGGARSWVVALPGVRRTPHPGPRNWAVVVTGAGTATAPGWKSE